MVGWGGPAAPPRQSLLRSQARCALLPAATPRLTCAHVGSVMLWTISLPARRRSASSDGQRPQRFGAAARTNVSGGSPREGARSELASGAATGGGGPQAPPTRNSFCAGGAGSLDPY